VSGDESHFGHAYGTMLWHHLQSVRKEDEPLRKRIFDAIEVMRELEPEAVAAWEQRFPPHLSSKGNKE
jgi:hypothetical protein